MTERRFPDPLTLLTGCILLAAVMTYFLPAGEYARQVDAATGRNVVVSGSYHPVAASPVPFFDAVVAIPRGITAAVDVVIVVLLIGGAFTVVDETGALRSAVDWLLKYLKNRVLLVIPVVSLAFAAGGVLENMQEEIIPLVPVLLVLTRSLGFSPLTAVAMSLGSAMVGSAFSPINPFQVGIAQKLAELPLLSGWLFRSVMLAVALAVWIFAVMRYANRTRTMPQASDATAAEKSLSIRHAAVLGIVLLSFAVFIFGVMRLGWDFDHMSALFFIMGIAAGLVGGLKISGTATAYTRGFRAMAYAAVLIGFARAIYVVLEQGRIVDTIVHALFTPIADLPVAFSALGMMAAHTLIHIPVPSVSGHAVLTMPLLVPLSDLLGLSRQITVLAYQYGAGLCEIITPTNGALMAVLVAGNVRYDQWLKFVFKWYLVLFMLGAVAVLAAIFLGV